MCPALTFIAGGSRLGLASSLTNLSTGILPIFFSAWQFRWAWARAEPVADKSASFKQRPSRVFMEFWSGFPPRAIERLIPRFPAQQGPVPELALLNPAKGIAGGFRYVSIADSRHSP